MSETRHFDERAAATCSSYSVVTFGCRVNQADSLVFERELTARGVRATTPETADLIIVNTCSVTATADQGARQAIRRLGRINPEARIVVTGCYATRRPDELASLPNVVQVVRNTDKDRLTTLIESDMLLGTTAGRYGGGHESCGAAWAPGLGGRTALTLRVQTGCDQRCSYCIIPSTRGRSVSRALTDVMADVTAAIAAGYKEITLTGVHLGSYGRDGGELTSLTALAGALAAVPHDVLFRFGSLEPMDCPPALVDLIASSSRLAPHFHLPLQHGSDAVLARMRRPYTSADYKGIVTRIRDRMPDASIGSDIIVGFPGETGAEFDEMCHLLADLPLTHLHVFPYSDRPGTEASRMDDKVDGTAIRARGQAVRRLGHEMALRFRGAQQGRDCRALTVDDGWSAVTTNYLKVKLDRQQPRNEWVRVRLTAADQGVVIAPDREW